MLQLLHTFSDYADRDLSHEGNGGSKVSRVKEYKFVKLAIFSVGKCEKVFFVDLKMYREIKVKCVKCGKCKELKLNFLEIFKIGFFDSRCLFDSRSTNFNK